MVVGNVKVVGKWASKRAIYQLTETANYMANMCNGTCTLSAYSRSSQNNYRLAGIYIYIYIYQLLGITS
jgi:hypothetical protein